MLHILLRIQAKNGDKRLDMDRPTRERKMQYWLTRGIRDGRAAGASPWAGIHERFSTDHCLRGNASNGTQ